ncbi:MAG: hypothetical protein IAI48_11535 [Candidatus Eremiobacteraeota bacterium]|nr:hypothetical protein [Candidatus Eremiobacteraeota bacterium]
MIERRRFLACAAALGAWPALRSRAAAAPPDTRIPFTPSNGYVTFPLTIAGIAKPVVAALNTGFTFSFIDSKRWTALGGRHLVPTGNYASTTDALSIGGAPLAPTKIALIDGLDGDDAKLGVTADVLLGFDAFAGRIVEIDFPHAIVSVRAAPASAAAAADRGAAAFTYEQYQPHSPKLLTFDGFTFDGAPIAVQLDTMWTGNAILFPTKFATAPAFAPANAPARTYEEGALSAVTVKSVTFSGKPLGTDVVAYVPAGKASIPTTRLAGVVGTGMFANRVVTLDFGAGTIAVS